MDLPVGGILHTLLGHKHLFVKLLAGTKARKLDLNILSYLISGELDQVFCQIQYLHRFSHIQDKDLAALCIGACLQYQGYCLRDSHEVADDIRICHGHRTAFRDLPFEQRDHAAVAAQHVAETHGHEIGLIVLVKGLDDHLADPLAGTHDIGGIYRLVRGDHDEPLRAVHGCGRSRLPCAEHVIFDSLAGAGLHQGHMLMGCCVINDIGTILGKNSIQPVGIAHRSDQHHQIQIRVLAL